MGWKTIHPDGVGRLAAEHGIGPSPALAREIVPWGSRSRRFAATSIPTSKFPAPTTPRSIPSRIR